jgi:hypothetical protein
MNRLDQLLAAGDVAIDLIGGDAVGERWAEPAVLIGYRVGGLAAHLGRALITVDQYLAADPPPPGAGLITAPQYFSGVLADHDPITSDFHAKVRERGEVAAEAGQAPLVAELAAVRDRLAAVAVEVDLDRPVAAIGGTAMTLFEYLATRLVELAIHIVDLADSVGVPAPPLGDEVWGTVAATIAETARLRNGSAAAALGLARPDRYAVPRAF